MVLNLTYDEDVTIPEINENNNRVYIGLSYIIISCFFMVFQIITFIAFHRNRENLMKNMPYRIMRQLGIVDFLQQLCHLLSGFFTTFNFFPSDTLNFVIGALLQCAYMTSVSFLLLLSLNRFDVFYDITIIPIFNKNKAFFIGIIICYIWGIALFIFFLLPENRLEFSQINYGWNYIGNKTLSFQLENKSVLIMLIISLICYLCIIGKIMYMRGLSSSKMIITLSDMKILFQAIINFFSIAFLEVCWAKLSGIITDAEITLLAISYLFILISGVNTTLNVLFIKEVRKEIKNVFTCYNVKNEKNVRSIVRSVHKKSRGKNVSVKTRILTE